MKLSQAQKQWVCPPELVSASLPRLVTFKRATMAWFVFWTLFLVVAGAAVAWFKVLPWLEQEHLLDSEGAATRAAIIQQQVTHDSEEGDTFLLTYEYRVRGRSYRFEVDVPAAYSRLAVGSTLPMHYAVSRPEISRLDGIAGNGPVGFIVFVGLSWVLLVVSGLGLLRQKQLLVSGRAACGIVTKVETDAESSALTVHYEFLDSAGSTVTGRTTLHSDSLPAPLIGDTVTIVHDPERPNRNMIFPARYVQIDSGL